MKNFFICLFFLFAFQKDLSAQLPNGSTAPDFTVTDINGNTYNLYTLLDQGKTVFLDFFATWCSICRSYHNLNHLQNLHTQYGPTGTNEVFVIAIEGDPTTSVECITGSPSCSGGTLGNWTTGVPFPVCDDASVAELYQVSGFPTILGICSNRKVYNAGKQTASQLWAFHIDYCVHTTPAIQATTNMVHDVSCFGTNTGSIDINVTGGDGTFSYQWSNGDTTQDLSNIPAGNYSCTISSGTSMYWLSPIEVKNPTYPLFASIAGITPLKCNKNGSVTAEALGGWPSYNYSWSSGSPIASTFITSPGTYTVTVTDLNMCSATTTVTLVAPIPPNASIAPASTLTCTQTQVTLNGNLSSQGTNITYHWSAGNGGNIVSGGSTSTPVVNAAGVYTLTVTNTQNFCTATSSVVVGADVQQPTVNAGNDAILCPGSVVALSGSGSSGSNYKFHWTTTNGNIVSGDSTLHPIVNAGGTYVLHAINTSNGCRNTDQVLITAVPKPTISAQGSTITCLSPNSTISTTTNAQNPMFAWSGSNGFSSIVQNPSVSFAGNYMVTVTDLATGCTNTATAVVNADLAHPGGAATGGTVTCLNPTVTLTGSSPSQNVSYVWIDPQQAIFTGKTHTSSIPGSYTLVVTGLNGCTSTANATISTNVNPPGAIAIGGTLTCANPQISLQGNSDVPSATFYWTGPNAEQSNTQNPIVQSVGVYTLVTTGTNGCTSVAMANVISDLTPPGASATGGVIICGQPIVTLLGNSPSTNVQYLWTGPNTENYAVQNPAVNAEGAYTLVVTGSNGCTSSAIAQVSSDGNIPQAVAIAQNRLNCRQNSVQINGTLSSQGPNFTFSWNTTNGHFVSGQNSLTPTVDQPGEYSLLITNISNQCTNTATVTVFESPEVNVLASNVQHALCNGDASGAVTAVAGGGEPPYSFAWSNGAETQENAQLNAGIYAVTVTDFEGCTASSLTTVSQPAELLCTIESTPQTVPNVNNGTATLTVSGGTGTYSFIWVNGETGNTVQNLAPGVYTVTVSDANNCSIVKTALISSADCLLAANINTHPVSCFGANDGFATVNVINAALPVTYQWSRGLDGTQLAAGAYSVTITDANNCQNIQYFQITQPDSIQVNIEKRVNNICSDGNFGSIQITAVGGSGAFTYQWSNGSFTSVISNLTNGIYTVTVKDASLCTQNYEVEITSNDVIPPVLNCPPNKAFCYDQREVTYNLPEYSDNCSISGSLLMTEGLESGSIFPVGTTLQQFIIKDDALNEAVCFFTVEIFSPTVLESYTVTDEVGSLGNGAIQITVNGTASPYVFEWYKNTVIFASTEDLEGIGAGVYALTLTDSNGCVLTSPMFTVGNLVATVEPEKPQIAHISPNPSKGIVQVVFENPSSGLTEIKVMDIRGTTVLQLEEWPENAIELDLSSFPSGIYALQFRNKDGFGVQKIVIQK